MPPLAISISLCLGAFLLGSIPFGVIAGRLQKIDLTAAGSGNIGASNAFRILGKKAGAAVLLLDTLKGFLPVFVAGKLGLSPEWIVGVGLCAVLGHIYSPWVRFKGGKGVATSLGLLFGLMPLIALLTLLIFGAVFFLSGKRVSVGSMAGAISAAAMFWLWPNTPRPFAWLVTLAAIFIVVRHRDNLKRLAKGEEKPLF
jgi:acyl phosphate:glycerol-3-phosphate acyltransferase